MTKQANKKVAVKLKNVRICENSPHLGEWVYKGKHQKWLSRKELERLLNGEKLRLMTIHPPKHTAKTLAKKRLDKRR